MQNRALDDLGAVSFEAGIESCDFVRRSICRACVGGVVVDPCESVATRCAGAMVLDENLRNGGLRRFQRLVLPPSGVSARILLVERGGRRLSDGASRCWLDVEL